MNIKYLLVVLFVGLSFNIVMANGIMFLGSDDKYSFWKVPVSSYFTSSGYQVTGVEIKCGVDDHFTSVTDSGVFSNLYATKVNSFLCYFLREGFDTISHEYFIQNNKIMGDSYLNINEQLSRSSDAATHKVTVNVDGAALSCSGLGCKSCSGNTCIVYEGDPFTLTAKKEGYVTATYESNGISEDESISPLLVPTVKVMLNPDPATGEIDVDGNKWVDVDGSSTYEIPLVPGKRYTISYVDHTGKYSFASATFSPSSEKQTQITLGISEMIYDLDVSVLDATDSHALTNAEVKATYDGAEHSCTLNNGVYHCTIPKDATEFSISASAEGYVISVLSLELAGPPQPVTILLRPAYDLDISVLDSVDSHALTNAEVKATYDGAEHSCTLSEGTYHCIIPHATDFSISASAEGYVTGTLNPPQLTSQPQPGTSIPLDRSLAVHIESLGYGAVDSGKIIVNNSDNTKTLASVDLDGSSTDYSFAISPQEVNVYFEGGEDFESLQDKVQVGSDSQASVNFAPVKTWHTDISVTSPAGPVSDYSLMTDSGECYDAYCVLKPDATKVTVMKSGYVTTDYDVPSGNNGSPISIEINTTLAVNVTDQNDLPADGMVKVLKGEEVIAEGDINDGIAWIPVDPDEGELVARLFSSNYITNTTTFSGLSSSSTSYVSLKTQVMSSLSVDVEDYYTNNSLDDYSISFKEGDKEWCAESPCKFDTPNPPEKVNISISRQGYDSKEVKNVNVNEGEIKIKIKPQVVAFFDTQVNVTVIDPEDDYEILRVESTDNGVASLPVDDNILFLLNATAADYKPLVLGPYNSTVDREIGSPEEPLEMVPLHIKSKEYGPVVTGFNYSVKDGNVTFVINASDEGRGNDIIDACYLTLDDTGFWYKMNSSYDSYIINASADVGTLSGEHNVIIYCHDANNGDGPEKKEEISIGEGKKEEEQEESKQEETEVSPTLKLAELKNKYDFIVKAGLDTPEIREAMAQAEEKIGTDEAEDAIKNAEKELPLIKLNGGGEVMTYSGNKEDIAYRIALREDQPYTKQELKSLVRVPVFQKTVRKYLLNGEPKSVVTLKIISNKDNPYAIVADFNPGKSGATHSISVKDGSISYFKGLHKGENVFEYVIDGNVERTPEPVVFDMKPISGAGRVFKQVTGFAVGVPGFEVPVIYIGAGVVILLLVLKFLIRI